MSITDLELLSIQLHSGLDMLYTIHEAMAERPDRQTAYSEALYGVYDYLTLVEQKIVAIIENSHLECR